MGEGRRRPGRASSGEVSSSTNTKASGWSCFLRGVSELVVWLAEAAWVHVATSRFPSSGPHQSLIPLPYGPPGR